MRFFLLLNTFFYLIYFSFQPVFADVTETQTFIVNASNTITVTTSGNFNSSIDANTGDLTSALSINFNINSNANLSNIEVKSFVTDSSGNSDNAFYCTSTVTASSLPTYLVLANTNVAPTQSSIQNCENAASTAENNINSIAYSGTISIDNSGSLSYNATNGYFNATVNSGTSNISLILNSAVKSGTFDSTKIEDENGSYKAQIYLDNIP